MGRAETVPAQCLGHTDVVMLPRLGPDSKHIVMRVHDGTAEYGTRTGARNAGA